MVVDRTARILTHAQPVVRGYFDWQTAGQALPAQLIQFEGLHSVSPNNQELTLSLVKAYMLYALGWVVDEVDVARQAGDHDLVEHHRLRAYHLYSRARDLALRLVVQRDPAVRAHLTAESSTFAAYLERHCDDDDLPSLYWLMTSWAFAISHSPNVDELADMSGLRVIANWIIKHNPSYEGAGALVFLGTFESKLPKAYGGDPESSRAYFERALLLTNRTNHIVQLNYALTYAPVVQNRALYVALLREIVEAPDQGQAHRLTNKIARRQAIRALARVDELFFD